MFRRQHLLRRSRLPSEAVGLFCNYSHRVCMQTRLDGFDYCLKHILEDKTSPFKQCSFVSTRTNRRCNQPARKADKREGYCFEHARKSCLLRQQASRKRKPKETPESLLKELEGYKILCDSNGESKESHLMTRENLASRILEYGSSGEDSDSELPLVEQAWRGDGESDAESIDSEQEDPLKHAGIYTAEEVTLIMRDKLIRLQSLYIEQFKRLQHILKEKRRKYLHTTRLDKDTPGAQAHKGDLTARNRLAHLAALKRYHQRHGKEALLQRQSKERRVAVSEGSNYRPPTFPRCSHSSQGSRCQMVAVPFSKFCANHVVDDPHQVLFTPCSFSQGDCGKPVAVFASSHFCKLHQPLPEPTPLSPSNSATEEVPMIGDGDTDILSAETSFEVSMQSEISVGEHTGLHLLAAQSSIMSAVSAASDALSASSDTLSATLDEPYLSSDVPSASSDVPTSSALTGMPASLAVDVTDSSADVPEPIPVTETTKPTDCDDIPVSQITDDKPPVPAPNLVTDHMSVEPSSIPSSSVSSVKLSTAPSSVSGDPSAYDSLLSVAASLTNLSSGIFPAPSSTANSTIPDHTETANPADVDIQSSTAGTSLIQSSAVNTSLSRLEGIETEQSVVQNKVDHNTVLLPKVSDDSQS